MEDDTLVVQYGHDLGDGRIVPLPIGLDLKQARACNRDYNILHKQPKSRQFQLVERAVAYTPWQPAKMVADFTEVRDLAVKYGD